MSYLTSLSPLLRFTMHPSKTFSNSFTLPRLRSINMVCSSNFHSHRAKYSCSSVNSPFYAPIEEPRLVSSRHREHFNREEYKTEGHSSGGRGVPLLWCLFGFSLGEFLGTPEEDTKEQKGDSELVLMIKRGILAFYHQEFDKAESLLHLALRSAQELADEKAVTYIYDVLANLAYHRQQYDKAEILFKSVLKRFVANGGDVLSNEFVAVSLKVAHCYGAMGNTDSAIKGYHYCIATQAEKLHLLPPSTGESTTTLPPVSVVDNVDSFVLYAMSLDQYSNLLLSVGQYPLAKLHMQEALRICVLVNGDQHLQTAILRNSVGAILTREQKYREAAEEMEKAIEIAEAYIERTDKEAAEEWSLWNFFTGGDKKEKKLGAIPQLNEENALSNLATFYVNLGSVRLLNGEEKKAKECCQEGERIAKRALDYQAHKEAVKCLETIKATVNANKKKS